LLNEAYKVSDSVKFKNIGLKQSLPLGFSSKKVNTILKKSVSKEEKVSNQSIENRIPSERSNIVIAI
jgi:hypothetical protein